MSDLVTMEPPGGIGGEQGTGVARRGPDDHRPALVRKAATGLRRAAVRREAEVLRSLDGRGVVTLARLEETEDRTELWTVDAGRSTLAAAAGRPPAWRRRVIASAAHALGELHRSGWAHGAVTAEHAVVDAAGAVTWCSLGAAQQSGDRAAVTADRRAFVVAALEVAAAGPGARSLCRRLRALGPAPEPAAVAAAVSVPSDTRPARRRRGRPSEPGRARPRRRSPGSGAALIALFLAALVVVVAGPFAGGDRVDRPAAGGAGAPRTTTAAGLSTGPAPTLVVGDSVVAVGRPGDRVMLVPGCGTPPIVALLRPTTGDVVMFGAAPGDRGPVAGRPVTRVPGAVDWVAGGPCGTATVRRADGTVRRVATT